MPKYRIWRTNTEIEITSLEKVELRYAGGKILYKVRPEKEKRVSTD